MQKILKSYQALVTALNETKTLNNKAYEDVISKSMETLKQEIDKFLEWVGDDWFKRFVQLVYFEAYNPAQYESECVCTTYDSMRARCRRLCEKYDTISSKKL